MNGNLFDKVNQQSEKLDSIAAEQAQQSEVLDQISQLVSQMQNQNAAPRAAAPMNAQIQQANEKLTLQRFIRAATKTYHYFGGAEDYQREKSKALVLLGITITVGVIANVLTGVSVGLFSTFSLVEDLWFFLVFRMICHVAHSKRFYDHADYDKLAHEVEEDIVQEIRDAVENSPYGYAQSFEDAYQSIKSVLEQPQTIIFGAYVTADMKVQCPKLSTALGRHLPLKMKSKHYLVRAIIFQRQSL